MKLKNEYDYIYKQFNDHIDRINEYAPQLKASGQYKDYEVRLVWDCLRAFVGSGTICLWYDRYNCNDQHIFTVGRKALKELHVL